MAVQRAAGARLAGWLVTAVLVSLLAGWCRGAGDSVPALVTTSSSGLAQRVIWAVNAGGDAHTDAHGVHYGKDPLEGRIGVASDYGAHLPIARAAPQDQVLYQTERYSEHTFAYEVPDAVRDDGAYVLVLKFAEVYFGQPRQKVFDVRLNGHVAVKDLDIFERAGHSAAHDELVPFSVQRGKLRVRGEASAFSGKLTVEFVKGNYDNPKVCALYVMKGTLDEVPKLPPREKKEEKEEEEEEWDKEDGDRGKKYGAGRRSGYRTPNPYDDDDNSSLLLPVLVAVGTFAASLFCLWRL